MSVSSSRIEEAALQTVVPGLVAEGFQVFVQPSRKMLPPFMERYQPDAIAIRGDKKVVIEVLGASARGDNQRERVRRLQAMFAEHPDWEFRVIYAPESEAAEDIPVSPRESIEALLARVEAAYDAMGPAAALLTAWAAFEAAARALAPDAYGRPQPTSRLVEGLAGEGYITPDEADIIRQLSQTRAQIAHGRLDLTPSREQVDGLIRITREMLHQPS
ncbi:MAG: hypothetical protein DI601_06395 [Azospirillum brasilense]|nr:MAG: hypothetical protein DI601_06395 [Azospirillum brasilense]PZR08550.1 MAG: hypothetical protein DI532_21590 [Azospirillum brasilense]